MRIGDSLSAIPAFRMSIPRDQLAPGLMGELDGDCGARGFCTSARLVDAAEDHLAAGGLQD